MKSPLPPREGISANALRAPGGHQTHALAGAPVPGSIGDWLAQVFSGASAAQRDYVTDPAGGSLVDQDGHAVEPGDAVIPGGFYFFHRPVPAEAPIPFEVTVVHEDADLLVVDKPGFLASTPNGRFVRECAVTRLRVDRDEPDLVAIHRLDRVTSGLLVLSRRPETRGAYQSLFQNRRIAKTYRAWARLPDGFAAGGFPVLRSTRLEKEPGTRAMLEVPGEPNATSRIEYVGEVSAVLGHGSLSGGRDRLAEGQSHAGVEPAHAGVSAEPADDGVWPAGGPAGVDARVGEFVLSPLTGKTHQLRVHMNGLGLPILGDPVYPMDLAPDPYDFSHPLALLAQSLEFTDPVTRQPRRFESRLTLGEVMRAGV